MTRNDELKAVLKYLQENNYRYAALVIREKIEDLNEMRKEAERAKNDPDYHLPGSDF